MLARGRGPTARGAAPCWVLLALSLVGGPHRAEAVDWDGRWWVGARASDYLPADEQGGGFRVNHQVFGSRSETGVKPKETFYPALTLGRGLKRWTGSSTWRRFQLSLEVELSRIDTVVGDETGFRDLDGSTRLGRHFPQIAFPLGETDNSFVSIPLGDLELSPVFANALFHWGTERADFYAGVGLGVVLADITESREYRQFTADFDGVDDVVVDDSLAVNFKVGSNVRLTPNGNLFLFFELSYFSTSLFDGNQVRWSGTEREDGHHGIFLEQASYDTTGDGIEDLQGLLADLRIVDPGKVRVDGASAGLGLRYRFGGKKRESAADQPETLGF